MKRGEAFFHPRRTAAAFAALEQELAALRQREKELNGSLQARVEELEAENRRLAEEARTARQAADANRAEMLRVRRDYDTLRKDSVTNAEIDRRMQEMDRELSKVEDMRASYERRIAHLKHSLADARALLADRADYDALRQLIDMSDATPPAPRPAGGKTPFMPSLFPEEEAPGVPENPASGPAETDSAAWLQTLPD